MTTQSLNFNEVITGDHIEFTNSWARNRWQKVPFEDSIANPAQNQRLNENYLFVTDTGNRCFSDDLINEEFDAASYPTNEYTPKWIGSQPTQFSGLRNLKCLWASVRLRAFNSNEPVVAHFDSVYDARLSNEGFFVGNYRDSFLAYNRVNSSRPQITALSRNDRVIDQCIRYNYLNSIIRSEWRYYEDVLTRYPNNDTFPNFPHTTPVSITNPETVIQPDLFNRFNRYQYYQAPGRIGYNIRQNYFSGIYPACAHHFRVFRQMQGMIVYRFNSNLSRNCILEYLHYW
jgi:hypothetical protein